MLFIGRTMNKETQLGRKEKGRGGKKQDNPQCCAYYLRNLTVITESVPCKRVQLKSIFSPVAARLFPHPVLQREEKCPEAVMCWYRCCGCVRFWCSAAVQSWCHGAIQLQRNMSHLKLPFLPGGWISLLPNRISSSFLQMRSQNVQQDIFVHSVAFLHESPHKCMFYP